MTDDTSEFAMPNPDLDKVTIGPSAENRDTLEMLVNQGHFRTSIGAFQAAALLAVRKNLDVVGAPLSAGTMWNRGSVNRQVLEFLEWYLPTSTPVRSLEQLGNAGTTYIAEKVRAGGYTLTEVFELPRLEIVGP